MRAVEFGMAGNLCFHSARTRIGTMASGPIRLKLHLVANDCTVPVFAGLIGDCHA
jgi:hypothetical protein